MGSGGSKATMPMQPLTLPPQSTLGTAANPLSTWRAPPPPYGLSVALNSLAQGKMPQPDTWKMQPPPPPGSGSGPGPGGPAPGTPAPGGASPLMPKPGEWTSDSIYSGLLGISPLPPDFNNMTNNWQSMSPDQLQAMLDAQRRFVQFKESVGPAPTGMVPIPQNVGA